MLLSSLNKFKKRLSIVYMSKVSTMVERIVAIAIAIAINLTLSLLNFKLVARYR